MTTKHWEEEMHTHNWQTNPTTGLAECSCGRKAVGIPMTTKEAARALTRFCSILSELP